METRSQYIQREQVLARISEARARCQRHIDATTTNPVNFDEHVRSACKALDDVNVWKKVLESM